MYPGPHRLQPAHECRASAWTVVHHLLHTAGTEATQGWESLSKAPDRQMGAPFVEVPVFWVLAIVGAALFGVGWIMLWVLVTVMVVRQGCLLGLEEKDSQEHPHLWLCVSRLRALSRQWWSPGFLLVSSRLPAGNRIQRKTSQDDLQTCGQGRAVLRSRNWPEWEWASPPK